jgi:subtilisin family serine protease
MLRLRWIVAITFVFALAIVLSATMAAQATEDRSAGLMTEDGGPKSEIPAQDKIDPEVLERLAQDGEADVFLLLGEQADTTGANALATKEDKGWYVYDKLVEVANRTQADLLATLRAQGVQHKAFWIYNMVEVAASADVIGALAARPDVERVVLNHDIQLDVVIEPSPPLVDRLAVIEWNIAFINADDVWTTFGVTGQGAVIGDLDTGVQWDHPALINQYRGWNGSSANHNYNWWDAIASQVVPYDGHGHGTHTTGTAAGGDGPGPFTADIGVAPGAKWIGCKNMTNSGSGTDASFTACFQFSLAPTDLNGQNPNPALAPDVVNNSWGYFGGNNAVFHTIIQNMRNAGIFVEVSAGNEGSACQTLRSPGDYDNVFTTGATANRSETIWASSSRGPSDLYPALIKPDIVAPGNNINSSLPGSTYSGETWSGTSMAGPHVVGVVALIISRNPGLRGQVAQIETILRNTAFPTSVTNVCGTSGVPNNVYGWGRVDALAAVSAVQPDFTISATPTARNVCAPASTTYTINIGSVTGFNAPVTLSALNVPAGTTAGFTVNPVTPPGNSTMNVNVGGTAAGNYTITVQGQTLTRTHTVDVTLAVNTAGPGVPTLSAPSNGATNIALRPTFQWNAATQATSYHIQVDDDPGFGSPIIDVDVNGTSYTPTTNLNATTVYYWRVRANNACGQGSYSTVFSFTTQAPECVLVVDDDNDAPNLVGSYTTALTALGVTYRVFDAGTSTGNGPPAVEMSPHRIVMWESGDKFGSGGSAGPNATDATELTTYLNGGGKLFLDSQDYLYDFGLTAFASGQLGVSSFTSDNNASATAILGQAGDPIGAAHPNLPVSSPVNFTPYYDTVLPAANGRTAFVASGGAGTSTNIDSTNGRTVFFTAAWTSVYNASNANGRALLTTIINYFGGCGPTPTPGPTSTSTNTPTRTNTPTVTATRTNTPTSTPIPPTNTPTNTPTQTRTPTATPLPPTATSTPSAALCTLGATKSGNNAVLSWTAEPGAVQYRIYRGTAPYFSPGAPYATTTGLTYTDVGAIADPNVNYYYLVGAWNGATEAICQNRAGAFDYALQPGAAGDQALQDIAYPLDASASGIVDAESLADSIGDSVRQLLKWDPATNNFFAWSHEFQFGDNFPTVVGDYIFLLLDDTAPSLAGFVGLAPAPGGVQFPITYGPANACALNFLSLPLDQAAITTADQFADSIGTANPPGPATVQQALDWEAPIQNFFAWSNEFGFGDNFTTTIGYPYILCIGPQAPDEDAYASQTDPTGTYGVSDPTHLVAQGSRGLTGACNTTKYAYVKFDLNPMSSDNSAVTLGVRGAQYSGPPTGVLLGLYAVSDDSWSENTLMWNNRPAVGSLLSSTGQVPGQAQVVFPTTAALVSFINAQRNADGVASMAVGWADCPPLSAPQLRVDSSEGALVPEFILSAQ